MFLFAGVGPRAFLWLDFSATAAELEIRLEVLSLLFIHALVHHSPPLSRVPVEGVTSGPASLFGEAVSFAAAVGAVLNLVHLPHRGGLVSVHLAISFSLDDCIIADW